MACVQPFRGVRARPDVVKGYDDGTIKGADVELARRLLRRPYGFLSLSNPQTNPKGLLTRKDREVFDTTRRDLHRLLDGGLLLRDEAPSFYVVELRALGLPGAEKHGEGHRQLGILAAASLGEYGSGLIRRHEHTRGLDAKDRARHVHTLQNTTGAVFLTYHTQPTIDRFVAERTTAPPDCAFVARDGVAHRYWVVSAPDDVSTLQQLFAPVPRFYVADGHHRSAAVFWAREAYRRQNPAHTGAEPYNYFMAAIFPADQLRILPVHRLVRDRGGLTRDALLRALAPSFEVSPAAARAPLAPHCFALYVQRTWHRLRLRDASAIGPDPVSQLDVSILQNLILAPVLGIDDPRTSERLVYIGGQDGIDRAAAQADAHDGIVFGLHPTAIEEVLAVSDKGLVMPPKSTRFEPKMRSGLVVRTPDL